VLDVAVGQAQDGDGRRRTDRVGDVAVEVRDPGVDLVLAVVVLVESGLGRASSTPGSAPRTSAFPTEAERVTNWVGIYPVVRALVRQPGSADLECRLVGLLDVVNHDVDVKLLRTLRIGPPWFSKIRHSLEGQAVTVGVIPDHDPSIALAFYPHA
jgi:hypothetical protein